MRDYASLFSQLLSDLDMDCLPDPHIFSDMGVKAAASVSLANSFYKKLCPTGVNPAADSNALDKFMGINRQLSGPEWSFEASNEVESLFYDYFKNNLRVALEPHESFGCFDLDYIREHMGVGPGAAQKADSSSMVTKLFHSSISYQNEDLIRLYRAALVKTGSWADAEMQRSDEFGFTRVRGGKLFFASKNAEISRVCCTESSLEMLFQKACGSYIEERLQIFYKIYLSKQPDNNRELARIGSLDGSIGTIDLVSASDCIMLQLCIDALPSGSFKTYLLKCRSRSVVLPDNSEVELKMVSTMGNGFTFPLQTLIFACAVRSVYQLMGFPSDCPKTQFGVFGDDICVRKEAYDFTCKMLTKIGFTVNVVKSFNTGPFRESCGHDYVNGQNIRGIYIKSLESPQQVVSAINRLTRWSSFHGISLTKTIRTLMTWTNAPLVPPSESDDAGIHVPFNLTKPHVNNQYWFIYRYWSKRMRRVKVDELETTNGEVTNYSALSCGFLSGTYRRRDTLLTNPEDSSWKHDWSLSTTLRDRQGARSRYKISKSSIPYWDFLPISKMADFPNGYDEWSVPLTRHSHVDWVSIVTALRSP